eukprot:jgi/Orpsp1_1/1180063/evm.model.c7180000071997.1
MIFVKVIIYLLNIFNLFNFIKFKINYNNIACPTYCINCDKNKYRKSKENTSLIEENSIYDNEYIINNYKKDQNDYKILEISATNKFPIISDYKNNGKYDISININKYENIVTKSLKFFFNCTIEEKTILIFEPSYYHNECLPGYAKYFVELGYNVDILIWKNEENSLTLFQPKNKLRVFLYENLNEIIKKSMKVRKRFRKYDYVLIQTIEPPKKELFDHIGIFKLKNTIFVLHFIEYIKRMNMQRLLKENRIITLGNLVKGIQINPHYFGDIDLKNKNIKTRFFITSSQKRKYDVFLNSAEILKKEGFEFEVIVVGRGTTFLNIPKSIKNNFIVKYQLSYKQMYEEIEKSDFIILTLDPENINENVFKNSIVSGSAQLSYGFLKPIIIHEEFAGIYNFTFENSFIYNKNNFTNVMKNVINLTNEEYTKKQINLKKLSNYIYNISIENLKNIINNKNNINVKRTSIPILTSNKTSIPSEIIDYKKYEKVATKSLKNFFNSTIKEKTILIFESNNSHNECLPGYAKYFVELGYNVDILIWKNEENSLTLFQPKNKLRVFLYENLNEIIKKSMKVRKRFKKYDYVLIQTTDPGIKNLQNV